jgi:hypothetical protein
VKQTKVSLLPSLFKGGKDRQKKLEGARIKAQGMLKTYHKIANAADFCSRRVP